MKKFATAVAIMFAFAVSAQAADNYVYKAKNGDVAFDHKAHSAKNACKDCHGDAAPAKIAIDKDKGHSLCKGCHADKKAGPVKCGECHKK